MLGSIFRKINTSLSIFLFLFFLTQNGANYLYFFCISFSTSQKMLETTYQFINIQNAFSPQHHSISEYVLPTWGQQFHSVVLLQVVSWTCGLLLVHQMYVSSPQGQRHRISSKFTCKCSLPTQKAILCWNLVVFFFNLHCIFLSLFHFFFSDFHCFITKKYKKMNLKLKTPVLLLLFRRNVSVHFRKSSKQVLNEVILVKTSNSIKLTWPGWQILKLPTFNFVQFNKQLLNIFHI